VAGDGGVRDYLWSASVPGMSGMTGLAHMALDFAHGEAQQVDQHFDSEVERVFLNMGFLSWLMSRKPGSLAPVILIPMGGEKLNRSRLQIVGGKAIGGIFLVVTD